MKTLRAVLCGLLFTTGLQAQQADLQKYLENFFPVCPGGTVTVEAMQINGPRNFVPYRVRFTSTESGCGRETFALLSPSTGQVVVGDVFALPADVRSVDARINDTMSRLLKKPVRISMPTVAAEDGLRDVTVTSDSKEGPFDFHVWLDSSNSFLIIGRRGRLKVDPRKSSVDELVRYAPVQRGKVDATIRIIEVSDFQCPTCKHAHDMLEGLLEKNLGRISYSRLDLPIFEAHDWSLDAALAGRAIQRVSPENYWAYVDYIFDNQSTIKKELIDGFIQDFVESRDIDWTKVQALYKSPFERKALINQVGRLYDAGFFATPTYLVNGREIYYGKNGDHLKAHLESILKPPTTKKKK